MARSQIRCLSLLAALALAGCNGFVFGPQSVIGYTNTSQKVVGSTPPPACPPQQVAQANRLASALMRLRLGMAKLEVGGILGDPAHAETFALMNGRAVEVFFYHTAESICRKSALDPALMPLVFQDDRLLGYGQGYYHHFIVPLLRTALSNVPENSRFGADSVPSAKAMVPLENGPPVQPVPTSSTPPLQEEPITPLRQGAGTRRQMGYDAPNNQLGAGEPLR